ncbi:MAG: polysaccharide deacetylase family protein [Pseudomonadota bacterium]
MSATSSLAMAACGPDRLGTARTITLDPAKTRYVSGKERALGLRNKEVILTFDDGPIAGNTSRVLKALRDECVKATFFYVGRMARAYPSLVRRVVREGHTLAHHTAAHNRLPEYSTAKVSKLVGRGIRTVERIAYGKASAKPRTPFFRYPYLARNKRTDKVLRKYGLIDFNANIDSLDWKRDSPSVVHDRIMRRLKREGRGIILMHDIQTRTAKMLPRLLRSLKAGGYKVVHVVPANRPTNRPSVGSPSEEKPLLVASTDKEQSSPIASNTGSTRKNVPEPITTIDMASIDAMANAALAAQQAEPAAARPSKRSGMRTPVIIAKRAEDQLKMPSKRVQYLRRRLAAHGAKSNQRLKVVAGLGATSMGTTAHQRGRSRVLKVGTIGTPPPSSKPQTGTMTTQSIGPEKAKNYRRRFADVARRTAFGPDPHHALPKQKRAAPQPKPGRTKPVQFSNWKLRPSQWILR